RAAAPGSAAAGSCSCGLREHGLERLDIVAAREGEERLVRPGTTREVAAQHALDRRRNVLGLHVAIDVARERGVDAENAADQAVIALDGVALLRDLHLAGEEPDVADIVLGAGVVTAGEMDVDRPVEFDA